MKWSMNKMNGMLKKVCSKLCFLGGFFPPCLSTLESLLAKLIRTYIHTYM